MPMTYVTASTRKAERSPHPAMAPAASSGPNAIADWFAAPISAFGPQEFVVRCRDAARARRTPAR